MKNGRMQAKDIDDRKVLEIVEHLSHEVYPPWEDRHVPHWVMRWDIEIALGLRSDAQRYETTSTEKVVLAKCAALIRRGLLDGCTCGCRGDFELTPDGVAFLRNA